MKEQRLPPRYESAIEELKVMILSKFPDVSFEVGRAGEGMRGYFLYVYPEYSEADEIAELVRERMTQLILDENIPVYVAPTASKREIEARRARAASSRLIE